MIQKIKNINSIFNTDTLDQILALDEVNTAKNQLHSLSKGSIYSSIPLTHTLKNIIKETFSLNLDHLTQIPMRWIKGDTTPHIDIPQNQSSQKTNYENTYLAYLTDSTGSLIIDNNEYPILKNSGYIFSEGLNHSTINTGDNPRLLLGPMNEQGLAVGGATTITADGETQTIYFRDNGGSITYKINDGTPSSFSLPVTIVNTNTNTSFPLKVYFENNITIQSDIFYFICGSENIQFGSKSLNDDGTRPIITIVGYSEYPGYPGLIRNGTSFSNGYNNISIFNLVVNSSGGSTLISDAGWIGQAYFGRASTNNIIINCSSDGPIIDAGGGIVGGYAAEGGGTLFILGCSSSGNSATYSGGIVGFHAGKSGGYVVCEESWSTGLIGPESGGIFGYAAGESASVNALNCYSSGLISADAGGIYGSYAGVDNGNAVAQNCYSHGLISADAGGIYGSYAAYGGLATNANNCYSLGLITTSGNGIYGSNKGGNASLSNYYTADGTWSTTDADSVLTGIPISSSLGTTLVSIGIGIPYILRNMGYTPYTTTNISGSPNLVKTNSQTISKGSSSTSGLITGLFYAILQITGGDSGSYSTIEMNPSNGVISTTSSTSVGVYTIYLYNSGSYNITEFILTVQNPIPCLTEDTNVLTPTGYYLVQHLKKGDFVVTSDRRKVKIVNIFKSTVDGNASTFPCIIPKNSISRSYPSNEFRISQNHLVKFNNYWILPKNYFKLDTSFKKINYFHIQLKNYMTDHLVINDGIIVESLGVSKTDHIEYCNRIKNSILLYQVEKELNKIQLKKEELKRKELKKDKNQNNILI